MSQLTRADRGSAPAAWGTEASTIWQMKSNVKTDDIPTSIKDEQASCTSHLSVSLSVSRPKNVHRCLQSTQYLSVPFSTFMLHEGTRKVVKAAMRNTQKAVDDVIVWAKLNFIACSKWNVEQPQCHGWRFQKSLAVRQTGCCLCIPKISKNPYRAAMGSSSQLLHDYHMLSTYYWVWFVYSSCFAYRSSSISSRVTVSNMATICVSVAGCRVAQLSQQQMHRNEVMFRIMLKLKWMTLVQVWSPSVHHLASRPCLKNLMARRKMLETQWNDPGTINDLWYSVILWDIWHIVVSYS